METTTSCSWTFLDIAGTISQAKGKPKPSRLDTVGDEGTGPPLKRGMRNRGRPRMSMTAAVRRAAQIPQAFEHSLSF